MPHSLSARFERITLLLYAAVFIASILTYAWHGLPHTNPQYDNQVIWYAADMREAIKKGTIGTFLTESRKYPLAYVVPYAIGEEIVERAAAMRGSFATQSDGYLLGRFITLLYAAGLFWITWRLSERLTGGRSAALLLSFSILTFMFASAIRPHLPVAFWTAATLAASVRLRDKPDARSQLLAWGSAFCAFATLQSGVFAFIFPLWALVEHPGNVRSWAKPLLIAAVVGLASLAFGYPFVIASLLGAGPDVGVDLGHDVGFALGFGHGWRVVTQLIGSEIVLLAFGAAGARLIWKHPEGRESVWIAIAAYWVSFFAVFAFHSNGMSRFFLCALPLAALAGAVAFDRAPRWLRVAVTVFMMVAYVKFAWLAVQPSTYQQITSFAAGRPGAVGLSVNIPSYFTTIPNDRFPDSPNDGRFLTAVMTEMDKVQLKGGWEECGRFVASRTTNEIVLLWNDTPWALWHVFEAKALGPNAVAFCARD